MTVNLRTEDVARLYKGTSTATIMPERLHHSKALFMKSYTLRRLSRKLERLGVHGPRNYDAVRLDELSADLAHSECGGGVAATNEL